MQFPSGECHHLECVEPARTRIITAFGTGDFCGEHAAELAPSWRGSSVGLANAHPGWVRELYPLPEDEVVA